MGRIDKQLVELGYTLPPPHGFPNANRRACVVVGNILYLSGHGSSRLQDDFPDVKCAGKVEGEVTEAQAYETAKAVALAMIASIKAELGDLDRVRRVIRLYGMVNSSPGFERQFAVIDGASDVFYKVWGPQYGQHARAAVGIFELPRRSVVEIMGEFEIAP